MSLSAGAKLGPFEIVAPLGAGGMGEVYRAKDSRLGRDVAIKALPEALAHDAERVARFEREARLLASLNHPNIGGIHGLEEANGHRFLILEFIEGQTLAERLRRGALPMREALTVCRAIAAALEAAHMSPEQARGKVLDRRTDIWSFGCVLFECLSGRQIFEGETVSDVIARIL